jgi:hypothetical protein
MLKINISEYINETPRNDNISRHICLESKQMIQQLILFHWQSRYIYKVKGRK